MFISLITQYLGLFHLNLTAVLRILLVGSLLCWLSQHVHAADIGRFDVGWIVGSESDRNGLEIPP